MVEEPGEGKEAGLVPKAPTPPLLKSHQVVVKKIKMQQMGFSKRRAAPSPGQGALHILPLYTGRADGFGIPVLGETLGVYISLASEPLVCRGGEYPLV